MTMVLHRGGQSVTIDTVRAVTTPGATETWTPIAHDWLIDETLKQLETREMPVISQKHALAANGRRYFGVFELERGNEHNKGYSVTLGLRNAHDKSMTAGFTTGSRVFVCDNMAFSGDIVINRRHTKNIYSDVRRLIEDAVSRFQITLNTQDNRFDQYKLTKINDKDANNLIVQGLRRGAITALRVPQVVKEWYEPSKIEHRDDGNSIWRLFNAFTQTLKAEDGGSIAQLPARTTRLTAMLDEAVQFTPGGIQQELPLAA